MAIFVVVAVVVSSFVPTYAKSRVTNVFCYCLHGTATNKLKKKTKKHNINK